MSEHPSHFYNFLLATITAKAIQWTSYPASDFDVRHYHPKTGSLQKHCILVSTGTEDLFLAILLNISNCYHIKKFPGWCLCQVTITPRTIFGTTTYWLRRFPSWLVNLERYAPLSSYQGPRVVKSDLCLGNTYQVHQGCWILERWDNVHTEPWETQFLYR